ncbi:bifunctional pyr operon transcriptional regulator/uracil phosphoribosyltransferase PyrR [candidate division KSB1 bacterium]|nr:bifunctional pyr operon transcriptional regulator/uracil phosphoribosyltransferase PyrR [candidate division KSB1 bacterium]
MELKIKSKLFDEIGLTRTITRLSHEIIEKNKGIDNLAVIGIRTRGAIIAQRICREIKSIEGRDLPLGILDITMYRDDFRNMLEQPKLQKTEIPFNIDDKNIVLIDDVIYTGRTTRAALEAIMAFGRPKCIRMAVLVDRGGRELPIQPDYVGRRISISPGEEISVQMNEVDDIDGVLLVERPTSP